MKQIFNSTILLIGAIALTLGFQNCKSVKTIERTKLEGSWQLKSLKGENVNEAFKTPVPTLIFNFAENMVTGNGGCNNYSGVFSLTNKNEFSARNPIATMRACIEANKEPQFFAALATSDMKLSLTDDNNTLLFTKGRDVVLEFTKSEEITDVSQLTGSWVLTNISGGDINELFDKKPTLNITEDGKASGNGGCNSIRTSYTLEGNTISFKGIASTKMACPSLKGEDLFTSHLATPLQVKIEGGKMIFLKGSSTVLEFERTEVKE